MILHLLAETIEVCRGARGGMMMSPASTFIMSIKEFSSPTIFAHNRHDYKFVCESKNTSTPLAISFRKKNSKSVYQSGRVDNVLNVTAMSSFNNVNRNIKVTCHDINLEPICSIDLIEIHYNTQKDCSFNQSLSCQVGGWRVAARNKFQINQMERSKSNLE